VILSNCIRVPPGQSYESLTSAGCRLVPLYKNAALHAIYVDGEQYVAMGIGLRDLMLDLRRLRAGGKSCSDLMCPGCDRHPTVARQVRVRHQSEPDQRLENVRAGVYRPQGGRGPGRAACVSVYPYPYPYMCMWGISIDMRFTICGCSWQLVLSVCVKTVCKVFTLHIYRCQGGISVHVKMGGSLGV